MGEMDEDILMVPVEGVARDTQALFFNVPERSPFSGVLAVPEMREEEYIEGMPLSRGNLDIGFMSGALLLTVSYFALFSILRLRGRGVLTALFAIFLKKKNGEITRLGETPSDYLYLSIALILSFVSLSVFFGDTMNAFVWREVFLFFLPLAGYHLFLLSTTFFLGWVFESKHCAREIISNIWAFNAIIGLILSPLVFSLLFVPLSFKEGLTILLFFLLSLYLLCRLIRWVKILFEHSVSILYMILYLCALEILPVIVLYKILG